MRALLAILLLGSGIAAAQPFIFYRGVVHAASYHPPGVPAGAIARGSIFSIFGRNLGPAASPPLAFPLQNALGGVTVAIAQGSTTLNAIPIFVGASQVNAILPSNTPLGQVSVRVTYNGQAGNWTPITVVASNPGIFSFYSNGFGPGIVTNVVSETEQPVNSARTSAKPGQFVIIWATGLGAIADADNDRPPVGSLPTPVTVWIGGKQAATTYSGRAPCCAGLDQIVVKVPDDALPGCFVPVQVRAGDAVSNSVTMAIHPTGAPCEDAFNAATAPLLRGGKTAVVLARRLEMLLDVDPDAAYDQIIESVDATFREEAPKDWFTHYGFLTPPPGSCTTNLFAGDLLRGDTLPLPASLRNLNAGASLSLASPGGPVTLAGFGTPPSSYGGRIGERVGTTVTRPLNFSQPGSFRITGTGADTSALEATLQTTAPLTWTNRSDLTSITRGASVEVRWSGADPGHNVLIFGASVSTRNNASARFLCTADPAAGAFTVPAHITANLPPAGSLRPGPDAVLLIGSSPRTGSGSVTAPGIERSVVVFSSWIGRSVTVR